MQLQFLASTLLAISFLCTLVTAQAAAGGGVSAVPLAPSQYPIVSNVLSLQTIGGVTTAVQIAFTQTFAATALGGWAIGPTPLAGTIGLGSIQGTVGVVKSKRGLAAVQTPSPQIRRKCSRLEERREFD
ncbi:hypothetical protein BJ875DRAFT_467282 [Amylocarpus encephaloides]|uniref:Uncharacterized protein n=1 Tax=Amylocarpus encephaloides TaxID=45428 RepID=A0A9P8C3N7_9HELO|nr:hypothetical protein BJ875DRAFT_467282 [Amylocarpus encephaloides]